MIQTETRTRYAIAALAGLALVAAPHGARAAEAWGIEHEKEVKLTGKVVDLLCALRTATDPKAADAKDCPPDCGGGRRQLGLLTGAGKLHPAVKANADFAGATVDLAPYCGRTVEVDGLLIANPAATLLMVQALRTDPKAAFVKADRFLADWARQNGKAEEWFRADPKVKAAIAADGVFGIRGLEPKP